MINFEPAAPAATNASVGYGQAEQFSRDLPAVAGLYAQAAQLTQHGQLAGLDLQQRSQQAATQGQLQDQHQQLQARQAGDQTALGYAALHQRLVENDQHAQNQAWLMQQDLSAKELMMMRQQENAVGEVMSNPKLDDQTKNDLVTQIRTHLDPAKARYEQQQARHLAREDQLLDQKTRSMAAHQAAFEQMALDMAEKGVSIRMLPDGRGGFHGPFAYNQRTGELYKIGVEHPELQEAKKTAAEQKAELERMKADRQEEDAWLKRYDAVEKDLRARAAAKRKAKAEGKPDPEPEWDGTNVRGNAEELMRDRGMPGTLAEFRQQQAAGRAKAGGQDAGAGGDYAGGQGQGPPPTPPPAEKEHVERNRPFVPERWEEQASADQKASVRNWNAAAKAAERFARDPEQLRGYRDSAHWAVRALATFGSVPAMPPDVKANYLRVQAAMAPFIAPPPAAGPAAAGPESNTGAAFGAGGY